MPSTDHRAGPLGKRHGFKVVTYLKMGCPPTTEPMPLVMATTAHPKCRLWNERVMARLIADRPDFVFTTHPAVEHQARRHHARHLHRDLEGVRRRRNSPSRRWTISRLTRNGKPFMLADCLAKGGDAVSCGIRRSEVLSDRNQTPDFTGRSDVEGSRHERRGVPVGLLPGHRGQRAGVSRRPPPLGHVHANDDARTGPADRCGDGLVVSASTCRGAPAATSLPRSVSTTRSPAFRAAPLVRRTWLCSQHE